MKFFGPLEEAFDKLAELDSGTAISSCDGDSLRTTYRIVGGTERGPDPGAIKEEKPWIILNLLDLLVC